MLMINRISAHLDRILPRFLLLHICIEVGAEICGPEGEILGRDRELLKEKQLSCVSICIASLDDISVLILFLRSVSMPSLPDASLLKTG